MRLSAIENVTWKLPLIYTISPHWDVVGYEGIE